VFDPGTEREVIIKVLSANAHNVRLGIDAPPEVLILREELINKPEDNERVG
jgi:carbon storage regulator CsrA